MIPYDTRLKDVLIDITEHQYFSYILVMYSMDHLLVRVDNSVELITSQNVFDSISNGMDINSPVGSSVKRVRVPFVSRKMSIRKAFRLMTDRVCISFLNCYFLRMEYI